MKTVRNDIDHFRERIRWFENAILSLQEICPHPDSKKGYSSWRPGVMDPVMICTECDKIVKELEPEEPVPLTAVHCSIDWGLEHDRTVGPKHTITSTDK